MNENSLSEIRNLINRIMRSFNGFLIFSPEIYDTANNNDNRIFPTITRNIFEMFFLLAITSSASLVYSRTNKQQEMTGLDDYLH